MRFCWKKYGRAGEVTDNAVILRMRFACWITTATNADSEYRGADKSLARPEMKKATATEDFEFHISYLRS